GDDGDPGQRGLRPSRADTRETLAVQAGDARRHAGEIPESHLARSHATRYRTFLREGVVAIQNLVHSTLTFYSRLRALRRALACALLLLLVTSGQAAAQSGSGIAAVEGTVTDPDHRPVPGALVIALNSDTGYMRSIQTDGRGRYF